MAQFYVKGIPTKRRHRTTKTGHSYQDPKNVQEEAMIANRYAGPFFEGKVSVRVDVYPRLPKSTPKGIKSAPMLKTPDGDNIGKIFMDALIGKAYADDKQVCEVHVIKHDMQRIECDYCVCTVKGMERE